MSVLDNIKVAINIGFSDVSNDDITFTSLEFTSILWLCEHKYTNILTSVR